MRDFIAVVVYLVLRICVAVMRCVINAVVVCIVLGLCVPLMLL